MAKGSSRTYVALSYVWGPEGQPHRTTAANLSSYMCSIDSTKLPQTIRDAIYITHHLGIDFLWVDSLCIIQDSPEDKHRELAFMRDVYRHAYLTIDAASAEKASDGFLNDRTPLCPDLVLPFICPADDVDPLVHCGRLQLYENPSLDICTTNEGNLRTGERAWCLQETLLSTRTLVFTPHTVQLRCQTLTQNIGGAEHDDTFDIPRLPIALFYLDRPTSRYSEQWIQIRERWLEVVNHYSRRKLSYPSDKLVACAGLAELFARALGSDYVAGLWNDDHFLGDLLWLVPEPARLTSTEYLAPSWSWASVEHANPFYVGLHPNPRAMATSVACACTPRDLTFPLGPVTSGYLVLQARMFRCKVEGTQVSLVPGYTQDIFDDSPSVRVDSYFDNERDACDVCLWAVPLQITDGDSDRAAECWGILLLLSSPAAVSDVLRAEYHGLKVFRRVGCFVLDGKQKARKLGWDDDWLLDTSTNVIIV
ncbi:heterokaryon incompatibility protein-domain-containing protein [Cubamyces menziesii]|uniref:Heterokaryon incompatibility domain-containing protein n=1 Tax=Trametes cubensis TaxID=1111947 RepID=A0AAD7XFK3_9APHY|nr:heterokaryon incompatibility protein-domain-containing protein [Cubamyces menziesii]KAJ8495453.1 hypothetical protein ONZ51_g1686 [Trametes cubensis]